MEIMSIKSINCNYEWTSFYTNNDDMIIISQCNAFDNPNNKNGDRCSCHQALSNRINQI